ncbi:HK97 gp10 family phage protein [Streptomyces sp. NPDC048479]|uniref:HK97 gp10 family phage protein n=1 Tax=Streptomyces sp. NPDC048479 TaxID=3154725 RepID=UPI0034366D0E
MNPDELADRLERAAENLGPAVERRIRHVGEVGRAMIRANASGRPGPNIITGDYWASWQTVTRGIPYGAECSIRTDRPQARRLEFGFTGFDSLGRYYDQPPFAHVGPAIPAIELMLRQSMRDAVEEVLE